jgi:hypothetical protein
MESWAYSEIRQHITDGSWLIMKSESEGIHTDYQIQLSDGHTMMLRLKRDSLNLRIC